MKINLRHTIKRFIDFLVISCFLSIINSCSYFKLKQLDNLDLTLKETFFSMLSNEYKDFAKYELYEMHDEIDSYYFAKKAYLALVEKQVFAEDPNNWNINQDQIKVVNEEYKKINILIQEKLFLKYPQDFSKMLAGYDCWIEQLEENWQIEHIEKCKNKYFLYAKKLSIQKEESLVNNKPEKLNKKINSNNDLEDIPSVNNEVLEKELSANLYFKFDDFILDTTQKRKLDDLINSINNIEEYTIYIYGHTDRKGSNMYNLKLSVKRANNVRNYLLSKNFTNKIITEGYGESKTLINTKDGVAEAKNRRTEIIFK